jgi:hypothetical protein
VVRIGDDDVGLVAAHHRHQLCGDAVDGLVDESVTGRPAIDGGGAGVVVTEAED